MNKINPDEYPALIVQNQYYLRQRCVTIVDTNLGKTGINILNQNLQNRIWLVGMLHHTSEQENGSSLV